MNQAVYGKTDMTDFSATVMDLVRKKVLKLSDTEPYTITLVDDTKEMLRHEKLALHLLFEVVGGSSTTIELEQVKKYAKNHSTTYYNECQNGWVLSIQPLRNTASHVLVKTNLKDVVASQDAYSSSSVL